MAVSDDAIGVAFDIGTTTLVGRSVALATGVPIRTASAKNPQSKWGADVTSRIKAVTDDPGALNSMRRSVVDACNGIIDILTGGEPEKVSAITAAGNTVMEHILSGVSPEGLGRAPYKPAFKESRRVDGRGAGFHCAEGAMLYTFPIVGGFVGGDTVAVMLSLGMGGSSDDTGRQTTHLAIDIGTNSEVILSAGGAIYTAATPAGPAFEGGEIEYGMTATAGAIEGVAIEDDRLKLRVIAGAGTGVGAKPSGICGSGLIEAAEALLSAGIIDGTGRIVDGDEVATNLSSRIIKGEKGNSVVLHRDASGAVTLSQTDIRSLQVAKASVTAAIRILLKRAGVKEGEVEKVSIAGAFGSNLTARGLAAIGVIPESWIDLVEFKGDAALDGAAAPLTSMEKAVEAEEIAGKAKYVSLSGSSHFEKEFIDAMNF